MNDRQVYFNKIIIIIIRIYPMSIQLIIAFLLYFTILLTIGLIVRKKHLTEVDFILGNRSLNFWLTSLSAHAADMSAWLFMAVPAAIFIGGLPQIWMAIGCLLGMFCNWHFVAPKLRRLTENFESYTLSTFFERRFNDPTGQVRVLTALMAIVFFSCYLSAGLIAMGNLFEALFGIDYYIGISIATFVVMVYTFVGGYVTVAWTDLFQAIFLLAMIILVPSFAFMHIGGFDSILTMAHQKDISLSVLEDTSFLSLLSVLFLVFGWGLGYVGQPHIITKFMGIKNADDLYKSKYLGMSWQLLALSAAVFVGLVGIAYFPQELKNQELVFVEMVKSLFNPFMVGIILCGVIAANVSTMDSQILVCASVITEDIYKHLLHRKASSSQLLKASRISVILISLVSLILACSKSATVSGTVFYAWTGLGCSFGPLVLMALYSKNTTHQGAMAGIIVGGLIAGFWSFVNPLLTTLAIPAMIPGFTLSLLSIYFVSKWTKGTKGT